MKKFYLLITIIALLSTATKLNAADILVEEFGITPAYPSITAAVAAAVDGDRIIIKNRSGNIPWIENITVDKSLEFLSYDNDSMFIVQGTYTIVLAANRVVTFISMKNLSGNLVYTGSTTIKSTTINVMDCDLVIGDILFDHLGIKSNIVSTSLQAGRIAFLYGNLIGNDVTATSSNAIITCYNTAAYQNDTVFIIGNKVTQNYDGYEAIYMSTTGSIYYIKNNYIRHKSTGINISSTANTSTATYIYNNTIVGTSTSYSPQGIYTYNVQSNSVIEIMNNVIDDAYSSTSYGIYKGSFVSGTVNVYYNHISNSVTIPISAGFTFSGNNQTAVSIVIAANGTITSGTPINGGNPAAPFYDLDLSAGDAGAYGGSFTLNNFFPLHTGPARVYFVNYPYNVRQGSTLNVKANAYDR